MCVCVCVCVHACVCSANLVVLLIKRYVMLGRSYAKCFLGTLCELDERILVKKAPPENFTLLTVNTLLYWLVTLVR